MNSEINTILNSIAGLGRRLGAEQIKLFGSRARGDFRERSDLDLAVFGLAWEKEEEFLQDMEELPTLYDFNVVFVGDKTDRILLNNIEREGISLMGDLREKYGKFIQAITRLEEGVAEYGRYPLDTVRDGVIQRFEFCAELAWKTVREYLLEEGFLELNSPKSVMRQAFAAGLVSDGELWSALLTDRNLTSHLYDEATAAAIYGKIATAYLPLLHSLAKRLKGENSGL